MVNVGGGGGSRVPFHVGGAVGVPLSMVLFHLVLGARYQLGQCPVSCSSCNIHIC